MNGIRLRAFITEMGLAAFLLVLFLSPFWLMPTARSAYRWERRIIRSRVMAQTAAYETRESKNARVFFTDADKEYVTLILMMIDLYYPLLARDFQIDDYPKCEIVVYPQDELLYKAVGRRFNNAPMGVYYGGVLHILSPSALSSDKEEIHIKADFLENGPIIHELAHFLLDLKTDGNYDLWFSEGVALYYEYKYIAFEWREDLKEKSRAIEITQLKYNFYDLDEGLAYRRSFDLINNLVCQNGEAGLQDIIGLLSQGGKILLSTSGTTATGSAAAPTVAPAKASSTKATAADSRASG